MALLNHLAICLCFAGFDELLLAIVDVKLKVVPFPAVFTSQMLRLSREMIPPGSFSVCYVLKSEAVVCEEPAPPHLA